MQKQQQQQQPLVSTGLTANPTVNAAEILPPNNAIFSTNPPCNTVMTSCAGCVQQQCYQPQCQVSETMEMTAALLHSQPPLQLVSCHGPIMHPATPSNQRIGHQVPVQLSSKYDNEMPEYSNLPQPRTQATLASAAANAATSMSFNSKRSRHSSLWSLTDDGGDEELNDMVNYGNDPFGHTNAEYSSQMMSSSNNARDASIVDQSNHHPRSSNVASASSFQNSTRHSASNEALN